MPAQKMHRYDAGTDFEGRLGVDVPFLAAELVDQQLELSRIVERSSRASQLEQPLAIEVPKSAEKLLLEDSAEDRNRHEEQRMAGRDPALLIGRQSAAGNDAVDMIVGQEVRTPRVQDGEEPDFLAESPGIASDFEQGLEAGLEQQIEQGPA